MHSLIEISTSYSSIPVILLLSRIVLYVKSHETLDPHVCMARDYGFGSVVCVCDIGHCDFLQTIGNFSENIAVGYVSSKLGLRFKRFELKWTPGIMTDADKMDTSGRKRIVIDFSRGYQTIEGFGGAFTDATGINVAALPSILQQHFFRSYFDPNGGIKYNLGRIPIASCDFSIANYSYDDFDGDFDLQRFALAMEDKEYKIPLIVRAHELSKGALKLFGSAWSCPYWLKTNHMMQGNGTLIGKPGGKYYKTWAKYLSKFVQEYERLGVHIWSLTVENEPSAGFKRDYNFQALGFTPETERDFIKYDLGPSLTEIGRSDLKLMILDDNRPMLEKWANIILNDSEASKYVSHIALHWYENNLFPVDVQDLIHNRFPNISLIGTEACVGFFGAQRVVLGSWERAEDYAHDIIENLNHWYTGWVDWNMALNLQGGPNWVKNFVDSPIIAIPESKEFLKQPTFYAIGHFSAFVPRNSIRVKLETGEESKKMDFVAFRTKDNCRIVIILNRNDFDKKISIVDADLQSRRLQYTAKARSLSTLLWKL